ncbi:hypothetical protein DDZ18_02905 [Marinicauda salina]|uniref:Uncharacterized protein n=1 Tax=Marinicauda salina TaxID=2135793 RepID=A0A2U2BX69_9PROT|nr:hypothetical protein [Marinicauda salina]PWE18569.1 hypothetical protein DDZ18_02905 [Marinicauda salina]
MGKPDHLTALRAIKAEYEAKLADNADFQALRAVEAAIEQMSDSSKRLAQPERRREATGESATSRAAIAKQVFEKVETPLTTQLMLQEFEKLGQPIAGKDPATNLASSLSRSDKFRSVIYKGQRAWWLTDRPYPGELVQEPMPEMGESNVNSLLTTSEDNA